MIGRDVRWLAILLIGCSSTEMPPADAGGPIDTGIDTGVVMPDSGMPDMGCDAKPAMGIEQLVASPTVTGGIAIDSTNAYWTGQEAALVVATRAFDRCDMGYQVLTSIPGNGQEALAELFLDGKDLYWKRNGASSAAAMKCTLPTCGPTTLGMGTTGPMTIDAARVYWTGTYQNMPAVMTCTKSSCVPAIFARTAQAVAIASDGTNVYWSTVDTIYQCAAMTGCAQSVPSVVTMTAMAAGTVRVRNGELFWLEGTSLMKCSLPACASKTTLASTAKSTFILDGADAFFPTPGGIAKCATQGCAMNPTTVVPNVMPSQIAVDMASVYWSTPSGLFRSTPK